MIFFRQWVDLGHEGLVVKSRKGKYQQGKRSADWTKLKGKITVDGFITGAVPSSKEKSLKDYIGGFKISAYVDGVITEIAAISNISMDIRTDATITVNGEPQLNPEYLNKCVEMVGQEFNKNGRLGSARINEWRPDKSPEDCKLTAEDIKTKDWSVYNDMSADTDQVGDRRNK